VLGAARKQLEREKQILISFSARTPIIGTATGIQRGDRRGPVSESCPFTPTELLVVIAIIAIVCGFLGNQTQCHPVDCSQP